MNKEREIEIVEMHEGGLTLKGIAEEMDISVTAVRNVLKKYSRPTHKIAAAYNEEDVIAQYVANEPVPEILATNKLNYAQLYRILQQHGIPTRRSIEADTKQDRLEHAIELYQEGEPLWYIKEETGVHQPTLHAELHKRHITLRRQLTRPVDSLLSLGEVDDEGV